MPASDANALEAHSITVRVPGRLLVEALSFELASGELLAMLGPNGVGKTLTLMTLAGLRQADGGRVTLNGEDVSGMKRGDIAPRLALMPQSVDDIFPATVLETALVGRHPHISAFGWESADDRRIAREALSSVGIAELEGREVLTLSGGERRRLAVAQLVAQDPAICLVDEPSNHLDLQHQLDVLDLFRERADAGGAVLASLHDINLAARYADRCLLLYGDGRWELGPTPEILTEETLSVLYEAQIEAVQWRSGPLFVASSDRANASERNP
jgi:iron complex transport system ATP-binding protein